jgi:hypothetical protein
MQIRVLVSLMKENMKTTLLLFLTLFCTAQICHSQAYRPFLNDSAHWTILEDFCVGMCDPGIPNNSDCMVHDTYTFKLDGDTTIGLFAYKKLVRNEVRSVAPCFWPFQSGVSPCMVVGLLWEDTLARKVYIHSIPNQLSTYCPESSDSILFDFSKRVGDTLYFSRSCTLDSFFIVDSINHVGFGTFPVKTWYMHSAGHYAGNMNLYESIGASVGFFGWYPSFEGPYSSTLSGYCLGADSNCHFVCSTPLGITNVNLTLPSISLHPNPTKDNLTLTIQNTSPSDNLTFALTNLLGQTVQTEQITQTQTALNIGSLPKGIYLWHLISEGNIVHSGKVIHE